MLFASSLLFLFSFDYWHDLIDYIYLIQLRWKIILDISNHKKFAVAVIKNISSDAPILYRSGPAYCIVTKSCISWQTYCTKLRALEKSVCSVPSKKCVLLWSSGETDPTQYIWTLVVASLLHPPQKPRAKQIFSRPVKLLDIKECWDELWVK